MFCRSKTISVSKLLFQLLLHLWYNFTKVQNYNNAMRRLFYLHFRCSASEMFANCNIHSMDEMRRTCIFVFPPDTLAV